MKRKSPLLIITALLGVTIATSFAGDPSAKTKAEKAIGKQSAAPAKANPDDAIPGADVQPAAYFYTGKPYDEDLGGYVFNYRTYSPSVNRWMTPDPSGFPDGANNSIYAPVPTVEFDCLGLDRQRYEGGKWIAAEDKTRKWKTLFDFTVDYTASEIKIVDFRFKGDLKREGSDFISELKDLNVTLTKQTLKTRSGGNKYWDFSIEAALSHEVTAKYLLNGVSILGLNFNLQEGYTTTKPLYKNYDSFTKDIE